MTDTNRPNGFPGSTGSPQTNDTAVDFNADFAKPMSDTVQFTPASTTATTSDSTGATSTTSTLNKQTIKDEAGKLGRQATDKARGLVDEGKARATGALDEFSKMMDDAAGTVDEKLGQQYGQYARSAAQAISGFSDNLRDKQVEELLDDARAFVRKSPAVAIGTAAALGFLIARVVKAGVDTVADAADPATTPKA